jgi:hypothetical protein
MQESLWIKKLAIKIHSAKIQYMENIIKSVCGRCNDLIIAPHERKYCKKCLGKESTPYVEGERRDYRIKMYKTANPHIVVLLKKANKMYVDFHKKFQGRERTRELVRIRDNHTCQGCHKKHDGKSRRFDVHHKWGKCGKLSRRYDGIDKIDSMVTLCHRCHMRTDSARKNMSIAAMSSTKIIKEHLYKKAIEEVRRGKSITKAAHDNGLSFPSLYKRV